LKWGA